MVTREVETELLRNARKDEYAFLRVLQHVRPPLEVVDLSPKSAEELLDRVRAARTYGTEGAQPVANVPPTKGAKTA
jgi:hypothetical protein